MSHPNPTPRQTALSLLNAVIQDKSLISELDGPKSDLARLAPQDAARARRLATETLRWMDRADRVLGRFLRHMPAPAVMNILRLGTVEICQFGEAAHGVVHEAVNLTRMTEGGDRLTGLVNATLRNVTRKGPDLWEALPAPQLPKWLRKPLVATYGKATVTAIEAAHAKGAALDVTLRDGQPEPAAHQLDGMVLPNGSVRLMRPGQVSALPGFADGAWWVQDAAAAMPVALLAPQKGEAILDLCAAPGGKTMQLAASGAVVTALDQSATRLDRVRENLERTRLSATLVHGDALDHRGQYDAVLLDAPCSATGTIRRHPDLPYAKSMAGFEPLLALQAQLLDHAMTLLKPGGRLVYCTCSLLPQEGEAQVTRLLERNPGIQIDTPTLPWLLPDWHSAEGGLRLRPDFWPDLGGMDGFYMARLRKN